MAVTLSPHPPERDQEYIKQKLASLTPVFASASIGDFSRNVPIPDEEDEFTELYVGVQIMIEVIREKISNLEESQQHILRVLDDLESEKEKVEQNRAKYEALLESIGDGLIATDKEGKIIFVNQAAEKLLGWQSAELLGKSWAGARQFVTDKKGHAVPLHKRPTYRVLQTGKRFSSTQFYYRHKNGSLFPVSLTVSAVRLRKKIVGAIMVFRDITQEKAIDKAKTEFVSLASHQLRTPLAAIKWNAEMLLAEEVGKLNRKQKQYLENMYQSNERMVQLVNSLLNVSRLELGTFTIEPEPVNSLEIQKSVMSEFAPYIERKKLKITEHYQRDLPMLNTDPKLLRIILQNIISNALKYTSSRDHISITMTNAPAGTQVAGKEVSENSVLIMVTDTGYGIPRHQQEQIFTKLFRADNARVRDTRGTGLGLYITKSIVDQMKGQIWFESEENKGTTFYVLLPEHGIKKAKKSGKGLINTLTLT